MIQVWHKTDSFFFYYLLDRMKYELTSINMVSAMCDTHQHSEKYIQQQTSQLLELYII